ncbi:unnamed protein product [Brugia pahangi]|uniref:Uncharacterized protein n=1 Tax=Brugia pahangi TaxID=6280 RepID=A0A0N4TN55_BRUPA|nr:unnamed protein product [Brugia pahangi]
MKVMLDIGEQTKNTRNEIPVVMSKFMIISFNDYSNLCPKRRSAGNKLTPKHPEKNGSGSNYCTRQIILAVGIKVMTD